MKQNSSTRFLLKWVEDAADKDIARLLSLCHNGKDYMITRDFEYSGPAAESLFLNSCFPIEISTSQGARSMGHCSDFVQYIYYAGARLSPSFSDEVHAKHVARCPYSSRLHGEFPISILFAFRNVRNYWMPNIEQIDKSKKDLFPLTYTFLGKTQTSVKGIDAFLRAQKIEGPRVVYMSHTSSDPLYGYEEAERDFSKFFHAFGHSGLKGTPELVECWLKHPEWPELTIMGNDIGRVKKRIKVSKSQNTNNIRVLHSLEIGELRRMQLSHSVHLCPSTREGFGHYINEARGAGALILTTDFGPMNEFVVAGKSGILIKHGKYNDEPYQLFPPAFHVQVSVKSEDICKAVQKAIQMPMEMRAEFGNQARLDYLQGREVMRAMMKVFKTETAQFFFRENNISLLDIDQRLDVLNRELVSKLHHIQYTTSN